VLTFAGAEEGLFCAVHALLNAGDHAIVVAPAYQSLFDVARAIGAEVSLVPLDPSTWSLDVGVIEAATRQNTRLVVINYPHSPTGAQLPRGAFDRLVTWCETRGIHLLSDEVYRFLERDPAERLPAAVDRGERTITLGVLSKAFGLAGLRVGWIATRDATVLARMMTLKDYTTICNSAPSEILALIGLREREALLGRSRAIITHNLTHLSAFFERQQERFAWVPPRAGTVCFPRLARGEADGFAERLVRDTGVLVLPGSLFSYDPAHFRMGFGRVDMPESLARFEEFSVRAFPA
jgi:aspartate/methionine/tyrosine aminotransferase